MKADVRIKVLETKIRQAEGKGNGSCGCVRKWKREIRNLKATLG